MKNSQNGVDNRLQSAEESISELEHMEIIRSEKQKIKTNMGEKQRAEPQWTVEQQHVDWTMKEVVARHRKERKWERKILEEIMAKNFPNLLKNINFRSTISVNHK